MTKEVLVPVDGSEPSWDALEFALREHPDANVTAYYVVDVLATPESTPYGMYPTYSEETLEAEEEHAESLLEEARERAAEYDADIETVYERGFPRDAILDYVEEHPCDQIVMGSHGRTGLKRVVIGSVAEKITRHAPVPVTIVRPETELAAE